MTDQETPISTEVPATEAKPTAPVTSAETENTERQVPYSRFKQILDEKNAAEARAKEFEAAEQKRAEAELTEAEKKDKVRERAEKERDEWKSKHDALKAERLIEKRDSVITSAATKDGLASPDLLLAWADKFNSAALKATLADDGTVDEKAVKALVDEFRKAQPLLFRPATPGSPSMRGGQAPQPGTNEMNAAAANQARHTRGRF